MPKRVVEDEAYRGGSGQPTSALPADLVRALDWVRSHLSEPIDLERLALVAGVRPRTLEAHFRMFLGTSPLGWVRKMRLALARRELEHARANATVTEIALASGFTQLGRFAVSYRKTYGEPPSVTLRRRRNVRDGLADVVDDEAFRVTLRAMPFVFAVAPRECSEALETLDLARRLAPAYGLPVALAAWCRGQRVAHGFGGSQPSRDGGIDLAEQACALAPHDALSLTLASGALTLAHRLEEADRLLERALALDPWLPFAWVRRGWASAYVGDPEAAFRELRVALHLAPLGPMRNIACIGMGCAHFAVGNYGQAARWVETGTERFPAAVWADRIAVSAAVHAGARAEARRLTRRLLRKDPNLTVAKARDAWPFPYEFKARLSDGLETAGVPRN